MIFTETIIQLDKDDIQYIIAQHFNTAIDRVYLESDLNTGSIFAKVTTVEKTPLSELI